MGGASIDGGGRPHKGPWESHHVVQVAGFQLLPDRGGSRTVGGESFFESSRAREAPLDMLCR